MPQFWNHYFVFGNVWSFSSLAASDLFIFGNMWSFLSLATCHLFGPWQYVIFFPPLSQRQTSNGMAKPILYHKTHTAWQKSYCMSFAMPSYLPCIHGKTHVISAPPYQWLFPCSNQRLTFWFQNFSVLRLLAIFWEYLFSGGGENREGKRGKYLEKISPKSVKDIEKSRF